MNKYCKSTTFTYKRQHDKLVCSEIGRVPQKRFAFSWMMGACDAPPSWVALPQVTSLAES